MYDHPEVFRLTDQHLALLGDMIVGWDDMYAGAPLIDCRAPYCSGTAVEAVIALAGITSQVVESVADRGGLPVRSFAPDASAQRQAMRLHRETVTALQIVLSTRSFLPGLYRRANHEGTRWERIG